MRSALLRISLFIIVCMFMVGTLSAQNCFNTGLNGTVINLPCNQNCVNVPVKIPHLKSTTAYTLNTIPYNPFPYVTGAPALAVACGNQDDKFFDTTFLPFTFCFYGAQYTKAVVGTNGVLTFDTTNALQTCNWLLTATSQIPSAGSGSQVPIFPGCQTSPGNTLLPRAAIFGAYYDIFIDATTFPNRKVQVETYGTAPCRKFVLSYFEIPLFNCNNVACTQQIVLYESTGVVEVYIGNKPSCSFNGGLAILGIQDWTRTQAVAAPGKNCTQWNEQNTGYQFVPSGGGSRYVKSEVFQLGGTVPLALGDTITTTPGMLDITFPSFCPTGTGGQYVIKTTFSACDNAANQLVSYDTITINKTNSLNATATTTTTECGLNGTGSATVTVPAGIGTAPYTFVLNPGNVTLTGNSPQTFTGLTAGAYTVTVTDASAGCSSIIPVTITSTGALNLTFNVTPTSCAGAANGSITVNAPNATPVVNFSINGGPLTTNNTFSNLQASPSYFISAYDAAGCKAEFIPVAVDAGPSITLSYTTVPTSCPGANNGSVTITSTGTPPFQYSIDGNPYQPGNTFSNLTAGTHWVDVKDAAGCTITSYPVTVADGTGTVNGTATASPTACTGVNNGSITVTASGTGPFQYSLNGSPYQSGNVFTNLAPGTYTVTIKEAGLCVSAPISVTVTAGSALTATVTPAATSCSGAANGTITVTPTSGSAPYTFILDGTVTQTGATTQFTGVTSGNHSVVVRDNLGCQSAALPVTVAAGPTLTGTATFTPTSCPGVNNGTITATATNGAAPYTYSLDGGTPQASNVFNGVSAGTHNVVIRTTSGCVSANIPVTVTAGAGLTGTLTQTSTTCAGINNGTITVTPGASSTPPYTFVLDGTTTLNGAGAVTFTNVSTGTHTVTFTDAQGCSTTAPLSINVTAGSGFTATFTATNSSCSGAANGSLTVTPGTGGTGPYTFVLDGSVSQTGATSTTFTNITSGTHSVLITDANGCQYALANATVNASAGFTATYTSATTSCSGAADGTITVTPGTGGTAPYTFVLGTTTQTGTTTTFTGLAVGSYNIQVTDANGCQFTVSNASVTAGAALTATVTPVATACPGVNNGSIQVTPNNGTGPYTFILDGTVTQTGATSTTFAGVAAGSHTIVVRDVNGCTSTLPAVNVTSGSGITATINPVGTSCTGATNGSVQIAPTNGTSPYTFILNGSVTQTGAANTTFTGLAAGNTYSIVVNDAIGCTGTFNNINIPQGSALMVNTATLPTSCSNASNGQITVTPPNGAGPYTFVLNGTTTQTGLVNTTFTGLAASTYSIVVTDAAGCVSSPVSATIAPGPAITVTPTKLDANCFASATGSISVTNSANATAPVEYSLNNTTWQTAGTFPGLAANSYTVYIRDGAGCTNTATITVGQPAQLVATPAVQNVLCNGQSNGVITVAASGGTGPYTYSINNTNFQSANTFNVGAGTYPVYVTDAHGCTLATAGTATVTQPAVLTATAVTANATCDGGNNGTITVTPTGGTSPYQYAITGGGYQATNILNTAPGTFDVTIKDANGCTYPVNGNVVGLTNNLTLTPAGNPAPICEGRNVQLQVNTNATQFNWSPATGLSSATVANPVANPATTTSYVVTATLGRCSTTDNIVVNVMPAPLPDAGVDGDICFGQSFTLQPVGDPSYVYEWSPTTYLSSSLGTSPVSTPASTITYSLKVTDNNGCVSLNSDQVTVHVTPPIQVHVTPVDTVVYAGVQIPLSATSAGTYYSWSPATGLDNPNIANPVATASMIDGDIIIYTVTTTTAAGCTGSADVTIRVFKGPEIYMVTGFTPNNDGKNETFVPFPVGIKQLNYFRVFNRWGEMMFSTTTLNKGWDGRFGGIEQPSGVYIWMIEGVTMDGKKITKKGSVTLLR